MSANGKGGGGGANNACPGEPESISVYVSDPEVLTGLKTLAAKTKRSRSQVITLLLEKYLPGVIKDPALLLGQS